MTLLVNDEIYRAHNSKMKQSLIQSKTAINSLMTSLENFTSPSSKDKIAGVDWTKLCDKVIICEEALKEGLVVASNIEDAVDKSSNILITYMASGGSPAEADDSRLPELIARAASLRSLIAWLIANPIPVYEYDAKGFVCGVSYIERTGEIAAARAALAAVEREIAFLKRLVPSNNQANSILQSISFSNFARLISDASNFK